MAPAPVQSLVRSLDILEALGAGRDFGLVEIAERTALRPSTVHRLLATLAARGYVVRTRPGGRYMLGHKVAELAGIVGERTERLRTLARPHLAAIAAATGESANLSVLVPPDAVYVDHVDGTRAVRMLARVGDTVPAHASAAGKAMLAHLEQSDVDAMLGHDPLAALTHRTTTTLAALRDELAAVRERGYAVDDEEHELGVGCVAAAILDGSDGVLGALSVSAPTARIHTAGLGALGHLLSDSASAISRALERPKTV